MPGKGCAVDILAALVERHQHGFLRYHRCDSSSFLCYPGGGVARAAFRNFMNLKAAEAEFAADVVEALAIPLG